MKNFYTLRRLVLPAMLLFAMACKKSSDNSKTTFEKILGSWTLTASVSTPAVIDYNNDGVKDADEYKYMPDCTKDDFYTFLNTGIFERNEGASKCKSTDNQIEQAPWYLSTDEKTLVVGINQYTIVQLDDKQMVLSMADLFNGVAYTAVGTYKRK